MKLKKLFAMSFAFIITGNLLPISQNISDNVISTAYAEPEKMIIYDDNDESNSISEKNGTITDEKNNITYKTNGKYLTLVKCDPSTSGQINIPDMIDDLPVKRIGGGAFKGCSQITGVSIPDTVLSIGYTAFYECDKLKTISLGKKLEEIGSQAFYKCLSLEKIDIPDSVSSISYDAFIQCENLKSLTLGKGITEIKANTFSNCRSLEKVVIPDSVTYIGNGAFLGCNLTSVKLSKNTKIIDGFAFGNNTRLKSITFPSSVETIGFKAFCCCNSLESVICDKNVSKIDITAFYSCANMKSLTIKNPVCNFTFGMRNDPITIDELNANGYAPITDHIVIKGYTNSTAETVAQKYGFRFSALPTYGDPTADGKINSVDASEILSIYAKNAQNKSKPSSDDLECCDINKDDAVNAVDASYILAYYAYTATNKNPVSLTDYMKKK